MARPIVSLFYTIKDAKNISSTFRIKFPNNNDIAIIKEFARSTGTMIDGLIRGKIDDVSIGIGVDSLPGGWKAAALPSADVEEGARFSFRTLTNAITGFRVPTFDEDFIIDGTKEVDLADTDVDAFVDRITGGLTSGLINVSPSDDAESDIVAIEEARESFGKDRG